MFLMKKKLDLMRDKEKRSHIGLKKSLIVKRKEAKAFEVDDKLYISNPMITVEREDKRKMVQFNLNDSKKTIHEAMTRIVEEYYQNCSPSA